MAILVLDVGTTTIRAGLVGSDGELNAIRSCAVPPVRRTTGTAEFDPDATASVAIELASDLLFEQGPVSSIGIATQRASTLVFDARSGEAVGPGLSWQDQRTAGTCLALRQQGLRLAPNQSATKLTLLLDQAERAGHDRQDLRFATVDTWLTWRLSGGTLHVTDATNAAVTGLVTTDASSWDVAVLEQLDVDEGLLPNIVDSGALLGEASALPGRPPIGALIGDQQASLIGQGCLAPGNAKATFGTGGMLDCCTGTMPPLVRGRRPGGTFPIVTRRLGGRLHFGLEGILLAAGSCIEWLRDGLGILASVEECESLAASVRDAGGVSFVPAFGGLATPSWDFGARGLLRGLDASTTRAEIARAVLEGVAHAAADLLDAAESDGGLRIEELRVDGGMAANALFLQLLANATRRPIVRSSVLEATAKGAGLLAGAVDGTFGSLEEAVSTVRAHPPVEPGRRLDRDAWLVARDAALRTVPFLSSLEF